MNCAPPDESGRRARDLTLIRAVTLFAVVIRAAPILAQTDVDDRRPARAGVDITLVGSPAVVTPVREVTADLLTRDGVTVAWRHADKLRVEDVIESPAGARPASVVIWVDLSAATEARVYFRAAAGRRFVIRRVSLPAGMGPLATEEIAQIIQSVFRALAADPGWALSLPEVRLALSVPEHRQPPSEPSAATPARSAIVEVGAAVVGQSFASELPITGSAEVSIAAMSRRMAASPAASFGGRATLGYGLPTHVATGAVGADLRTARLRLSLVWEAWRQGRVAIRFGLGGGGDRVAYTPSAELPGATAAAEGTFFTAIGCADATLHLDVSPRFALAAAAIAEMSLQRVHYDAYDGAGDRKEVLVPYRVRPGIVIGVEGRL
jgi:hypothetical protein